MTSSLSPLGCEEHEWIPVTWAVIRSICQSIESYLESQSINRIQLIVHLGTPRAVQHHHIATLLEGGYRPGLARSTTRRAGRPRCSTSAAGSQNKIAAVDLSRRKMRTARSSVTRSLVPQLTNHTRHEYSLTPYGLLTALRDESSQQKPSTRARINVDARQHERCTLVRTRLPSIMLNSKAHSP